MDIYVYFVNRIFQLHLLKNLERYRHITSERVLYSSKKEKGALVNDTQIYFGNYFVTLI